MHVIFLSRGVIFTTNHLFSGYPRNQPARTTTPFFRSWRTSH